MRNASFVSPMINPLSLNLEQYVRLSPEDRDALDELRTSRLIEARARTDLVREGDRPDVVRLMVSGWACRYKDLPDGRRQIVGLFIPGEFCDLNVYILQRMDHSIGAITKVQYYAMGPEVVQRLTQNRPRVGQALLWHELVTTSVQREWLRATGHTRGHTFDLPLTQNDLADATGITAVHVNRTLQELRRDNLIAFERKQLTILDLDRMMKLAIFNPNYLHLDQEGRHLDANS
jgi:CRP-like cAMP-binding protein